MPLALVGRDNLVALGVRHLQLYQLAAVAELAKPRARRGSKAVHALRLRRQAFHEQHTAQRFAEGVLAERFVGTLGREDVAPLACEVPLLADDLQRLSRERRYVRLL